MSIILDPQRLLIKLTTGCEHHDDPRYAMGDSFTVIKSLYGKTLKRRSLAIYIAEILFKFLLTGGEFASVVFDEVQESVMLLVVDKVEERTRRRTQDIHSTLKPNALPPSFPHRPHNWEKKGKRERTLTQKHFSLRLHHNLCFTTARLAEIRLTTVNVSSSGAFDELS